MKRLENKVAIVTGGAGSIGRTTAKHFLDEGAKLLLEDLNEEALVSFKREGQLNLFCRNVKFTFFEFEYNIPHPILIHNSITIPSLLDLAAMKAFALGMRSKWKDYLDLYFILK